MADATLCRCGKKMRHIGRCQGEAGSFPSPRIARPKVNKLLLLMQDSVHKLMLEISKTKAVIREEQDKLLTLESQLGPARTYLKALEPVRIEGPPPPVALAAAVEDLESRASAFAASHTIGTTKPARTEDDVKDNGIDPPLPRSFKAIEKWAYLHNMSFKSWNDLKAVNERRERMGTTPFCRDMSAP